MLAAEVELLVDACNQDSEPLVLSRGPSVTLNPPLLQGALPSAGVMPGDATAALTFPGGKELLSDAPT